MPEQIGRRSTSRWPPTATTASGSVQEIAPPASTRVDSLAHALRRLPGDGGAVGDGRGRRGLLRPRPGRRPATSGCCSPTSPPPTSGSWPSRPSTSSACPPPEDDDDQVPAGDLDLLGDLGMHAMDMGVLLDDVDLYPDEMLSDVARRARLRRALRRRRRAHLCMTAPAGRLGDADAPRPRRGARGRWRPATSRSAPSSSTPPARCSAAAATSARRDGDPTGHAEVVALRAAAARLGEWRLTGCTLVVTLEPCTMCAGAAVLARVERVVFGAYDDKAGAVGSLWDVVRDRRLNHRPEVVGGVLAAESTALLDGVLRPAEGDLAPRPPSGNLSRGGVSERPKVHHSK